MDCEFVKQHPLKTNVTSNILPYFLFCFEKQLSAEEFKKTKREIRNRKLKVRHYKLKVRHYKMKVRHYNLKVRHSNLKVRHYNFQKKTDNNGTLHIKLKIEQ